MNIWDIANLAGMSRIALGITVIGLIVVWSRRHHHQRPQQVRIPTRTHRDHR